jgi:hypothetical protein
LLVHKIPVAVAAVVVQTPSMLVAVVDLES